MPRDLESYETYERCDGLVTDALVSVDHRTRVSRCAMRFGDTSSRIGIHHGSEIVQSGFRGTVLV